MRFSIDIDYPAERFEANARRMAARGCFDYHDRVPVSFCLAPRYFAPLFDLPYHEFFKDPDTQFYWQLQFAKYRMENIPEDTWTDAAVTVGPYFDNVINAGAFGAEIGRPPNETLRALPVLKGPGDAESLAAPAADAGLWGTVGKWWARMNELARRTRVTFAGGPGRVQLAPAAIGGEGPHMVAVDLAGADFYAWMLECPDVCHRLLDKITTGMIRAERAFRRLDPRPRTCFGLAEDSAQIMSAELFRRFCVPYDSRLYEAFGGGLRDGRGMHMCGDSTHLHRALVDDLRISSFNLFGYRVPPAVAAANLGGRMYLWGNLNPMLLRDGTKDQVKRAAEDCLQALAPCGGFLLGDGANICPGTPAANLAAVTEAAEDFGRPVLTSRPQKRGQEPFFDGHRLFD